ncbi:MAG: metal-sensitive transcriptional regulator [Gammaproteobacteria bacterium]|jgi:DNA-binding FrmR family transcriptional regulator
MSHPCHEKQLPSLKRIEGQVRGVTKMIEEKKYCIDILNQIKAVKNALSTVEGKIVRNHLQACVKDALEDNTNFDNKVDELVKALKR